jgi:hypothetical protein
MENLTLKNYQEHATKAIVAKAKKLLARDIESIAPNKFVAYVDDASDSFDVAIEFENEKIKDLTCDCEKGISFCVHKIALLNLIKNNKPEKATVLKRKKSESEILLNDLDELTLRVWVQELFKKNKDFELLFVTEFSKSEIFYDKKEIKIIIDKAIKSVIKNKRSVDATELKRIIEVLDISLKPVLKFCKDAIASPETNDLLLYIYSELLEFNYEKYISGVKLLRFIEKIYKEINLFVHNIKDKEQWESIVEETIHFIFYKKQLYEMEMDVVYHLYDSIDQKERKLYFAKVIFDLFIISVKKQERYVKKINMFFLKVFSENDFFKKVYSDFQPMYYENDYNILLLEKLLEIEKYELAEKMALEQIERNSNDKYNVGYFQVLKTIYEITKDEKKSALLQMKTIFYDFTLEKYISIEKYCEESAFKIFRTKLLTAFKRNFYESPKYVKAYFEIFYHDKKYKQMIENISEKTSYELIYEYKDELFAFDKLSFLIGLTNIERNNYFSTFSDKKMTEYREKFIVWIKEKYDTIMIDNIVKRQRNFHHSALLYELQQN